MNKETCPNCKKRFEKISLSDVRQEQNTEITGNVVAALNNFFDFYVCSKCGRTIIYSKPALIELAADNSDAIIGNS